MAIPVTSYVNNGNGTADVSILFDNVPRAKADPLLLEAARYAYEVMGKGVKTTSSVVDGETVTTVVPFNSLTNNERLQVIGAVVQYYLIELAKAQHAIAADVVKAATVAQAPSTYDI